MSRTYRSQCRPATGAALRSCHAPNGATESTMCRSRTPPTSARKAADMAALGDRREWDEHGKCPCAGEKLEATIGVEPMMEVLRSSGRRQAPRLERVVHTAAAGPHPHPRGRHQRREQRPHPGRACAGRERQRGHQHLRADCPPRPDAGSSRGRQLGIRHGLLGRLVRGHLSGPGGFRHPRCREESLRQ